MKLFRFTVLIHSLVAIALLATAVPAARALSSVPVSGAPAGATLTYTYTFNQQSYCGESETGQNEYQELFTYSGFQYVLGSMSYPLSGTATYTVNAIKYIPPCSSNDTSAVLALPPSYAPGSTCTITFNPSGNGNKASLSCVGGNQVATGIYPYGTFDNQGFDTINVGNLDVHFVLPVLNKAGRGVPFQYSLSYDSSIWYFASVNGAGKWQPVGGFGWNALTAAVVGYVSANAQQGATCSSETIWSNFVYHDAFGGAHAFAGGAETALYAAGSSCPPDQQTATFTATATDGSGYTISASLVAESPTTWTVTAPNNAVTTGSLNSDGSFVPNPTATYTNPNGNEITESSNGEYTDTTGKVALTVTGAAPSPVTMVYTGVNGNPETVSMNYSTYTVQTNFGCSGIAEYGPLSQSLVSSITYPDGSTYNFSYEPTPGVSGSVTGRLASVELRQGGVIQYTYSGGNGGIECADGSTAGLTRTLNGDSGSAASTWSYARTIISTWSSKTAVVDGLGNSKLYTFYMAGNEPTGIAAQYYETGRSVYNGAATGTPVLTQQTCYNGYAPPCSNFLQPISQIDTYKTRDGVATNGTTSMFNANGMQTEAEVWDFGASSRGALLRKEVWTYGYSVPSAITLDAIFDGSGTVAGSTYYGYDGTAVTVSSGVPQHTSVSTARGNLTSMTQYANSLTSYMSSFTYEDTGSLLTSTNPNGTTTYSYDPTFVYQTGTSLPTPSSGVALSTSASFDTANTGLPLTSTDANAQITKTPTYDALLRATEIEYPDGGETTFSYSPTVTIASIPAISAMAETEYDGYGRLSRVETANGQAGNGYYQQDTCYDANSNAIFKSYRYQGSGFGAGKVCSGAGDTTTYDVLGRVTSVVRANGETRSYTYLGRAKKSVDPNGVTRISQLDGLGRMTIVCEISSNGSMPGSGSPTSCGTDIAGMGFTITYSYALATPTTTITQGAQMRVFQYDWLKRPILVQEPESGTTTYSYAYNATGLQVTRTRPQANQTGSATTTTTTQYDALGRGVSISYSDGTPAKSFAYDASVGWGVPQANLKGRLSEAWANGTSGISNAGTIYSYDPMGRATTLAECTPSICGSTAYILSYTYDLAGDMTSSSDGGGAVSTYTYSPASEILSLTSSVSNETDPADILSNVQNGPFGPVGYNLGNGLTGAYSYDALGRLGGGTVSSSGTQVYGFADGWRGKQLTGSSDSILAQGSTYGYDEFNRLNSRTVNAGTGPNYGWVYDRYGNRWQQNITGGTGNGSTSSLSFNTTTNQINTAGYTYDAAGNMRNDGFHSYTYDAEGNITAVDGGSTATYVYNALNQRVRATVGSAITEYVFNAAGQRVSEWNGATHAQIDGKYYWGAKPVAYYAGGAAHFEHQDWLGTERIRTTYNGSVEGSYQSLPFGDGQATTGADTDANHFAQLDLDAESGTAHAQQRQDSNAQGRWLSPDPYSGSYKMRNPQSFNRYAYALNNPLAATDPSGLLACLAVPVRRGVRGMGVGGCYYDGGEGGGGGGAPEIGSYEFDFYDTVSSSYGTYSYAGDVWDNMMQDGYGGGITDGPNNELLDSDGDVVGYTWQTIVPVDSIQTSLTVGQTGTAPNNVTRKPGIMDPFVARENAQFNQCVTNGGPLAIAQGAMDSLGNDSSANKAAINIMGAALDIQKRCLELYPLAVLSPNYNGLFGAGDLVNMF